MYTLTAKRDGLRVHVIQSASELPDPKVLKPKAVYLDIESENNTQHIEFEELDEAAEKKVKGLGGLYPFGGDRVAGFAVTWDDCEDLYYVPVRHKGGGKNVPNKEAVFQWVTDMLQEAEEWRNHNVALDACFMLFEDVKIACKLVCTLALAKVHDSDRMGHGLKQLAADWLDEPYDEEVRIKEFLKRIGSKSYGDLPVDLAALYAARDIHVNRRLYHKLAKERPDEVAGIWEMETGLTPVLLDTEIRGLKINPMQVKIEQVRALKNVLRIEERIVELADREFTNSHACVYDILINQFDLPVLVTKKQRVDGVLVDTGRPTFDRDALKVYAVHPKVRADPKMAEIVDLIMAYRLDAQFLSLFLNTFNALKDSEDCIHPSYNQIVRTGRMSCSRPNIQQQNKRSKALIVPRPGYGFISCDASQVEFRLIVHYIQDEEAIQAYNENPDTDFHRWVGEAIGITRSAAKPINFGIAYGMGKKTTTRNLAGNPDIIAAVNEDLRMEGVSDEERIARFEELCFDRATRAYNNYHDRFPGMKITSRKAASVCYHRGYIRTAYGRRRHLPQKASHKAFNSLIQGGAMDLIKDRILAISERYNERMRDWGIHLMANVHDEVLFECPLELLYSEEVHDYILGILENPSVPFRVPIRWGLGISSQSWAVAAGDDTLLVDGQVEGKLRCEAARELLNAAA